MGVIVYPLNSHQYPRILLFVTFPTLPLYLSNSVQHTLTTLPYLLPPLPLLTAYYRHKSNNPTTNARTHAQHKLEPWLFVHGCGFPSWYSSVFICAPLVADSVYLITRYIKQVRNISVKDHNQYRDVYKKVIVCRLVSLCYVNRKYCCVTDASSRSSWRSQSVIGTPFRNTARLRHSRHLLGRPGSGPFHSPSAEAFHTDDHGPNVVSCNICCTE